MLSLCRSVFGVGGSKLGGGEEPRHRLSPGLEEKNEPALARYSPKRGGGNGVFLYPVSLGIEEE